MGLIAIIVHYSALVYLYRGMVYYKNLMFKLCVALDIETNEQL